MFDALNAGQVDAVAQTNYYDPPEGLTVLAKCDAQPVYIVLSKTTRAQNRAGCSAMTQLLSYNPGFNADIYQYHFRQAASQAAVYTQAEKPTWLPSPRSTCTTRPTGLPLSTTERPGRRHHPGNPPGHRQGHGHHLQLRPVLLHPGCVFRRGQHQPGHHHGRELLTTAGPTSTNCWSPSPTCPAR